MQYSPRGHMDDSKNSTQNQEMLTSVSDAVEQKALQSQIQKRTIIGSV